MLHGHLLGLYEKALPFVWSWEKRLLTAKSLGFDFVELSIDAADERIERLYWNPSQKKELREICFDVSMPLTTMCLSAHRRFPFGSSNPFTKAKAYEIMERAILFAKELGIRVIQLAGYDVYDEQSTEYSAQAFLEGMEWAAKFAEKHQMMLAMEIMDTPFMNSILKYLWYEKQINSPWFKVYPDLGNLTAWGNDVVSELTKGISSIVAVHIKEALAVTDTFEGKFKRVPFGTGCVDFAKCFATLEQLNYQGPYMVEMWNEPDQNDVAIIRDSLSFINDQYNIAMRHNKHCNKEARVLLGYTEVGMDGSLRPQ